MLVKNGYNLNYYKLNDDIELEFLIPYKDQVIPIEVKAGNTATVSLNRFIDKYKPVMAYKFITGNIGVADTKVTMPLYMAMFLKK
jgi:hypothetical protein